MVELEGEVEGEQGAGVWSKGSKQRGEWVVNVVDFGGFEVADVEVDTVVEVEVEPKGCEWSKAVGVGNVDVEEVATTVVFGPPKIVDGKLNT